jgi:hypothetical protein
MKSAVSLGLILSVGLLAGSASAGTLTASGTWTGAPDGADFRYSITLTNSGSSTDNLGTFWFGWQPGGDYLSSSPISETSPSGWTANVTHFGSSDGYGIQWVAGSGSSLAPGNSLTFGFVSTLTPAELAGFSPIDPTKHETASYVYQGAPFASDGSPLVVSQAVPEPSSLVLGLVAVAGTLLYAGARRARKSSIPHNA